MSIKHGDLNPPTPLSYKERGVLKPLPVSGRGLERGLFSFLEMSNNFGVAFSVTKDGRTKHT
jgi:hypothetical protein